MGLLVYNIFLHSIAAPALAVYYLPQIILGKKYKGSWREKLGLVDSNLSEKLSRPRVWFHAVSVGEVTALAPLIRAFKSLLPEAAIIVSTGTETGQAKAASQISEADALIYMPLDFPFLAKRVVNSVKPDLFVLMETELWPNLINIIRKSGAAVVLANGRISDRSFPRYVRLKRFLSSTFSSIQWFLMSSELDAKRIIEMGAPENRTMALGNTKFDAVLLENESSKRKCLQECLSIDSSDMVLVAGSVHPGEYEIVLSVHQKLCEEFPNLLLILVPRHVEKIPLILEYMKKTGMQDPFLRSSAEFGQRRSGSQIILVDRTGELFDIFSLATVVFMGGSIVPKGGQNILEPAAWGKPVIFGPSMEDFRDAREILMKCGAGFQVNGADDLTETIRRLLCNPSHAQNVGEIGRLEISKQSGSAMRIAEILRNCLFSS
jgi:3-deoxy-D-manno-octulosonic-acid transferase